MEYCGSVDLYRMADLPQKDCGYTNDKRRQRRTNQFSTDYETGSGVK